MSAAEPLLRIEDLGVTYGRGRRAKPVVRDVSLSVGEGRTLGVVGESGAGKSTIGRAVLGLVKPSAGRIWFDGQDITHLSFRGRRAIASDLQVVFQDPRSSLNDAKKVGAILVEPVVAGRRMSRRQARERAVELLVEVGLTEAAMDRLPSNFSGGQRQRVAIARALMPSPKLVICDEPVSSLDLSVQAQIINLFRRLQRETGVSYVFIAHDLAVVRLLSENIAVMSDGRIVEFGPAAKVYEKPAHPYTKRLLAAEPYPDPVVQRQRRAEWEALSAAAAGVSS